jgi:hypothetical protein
MFVTIVKIETPVPGAMDRYRDMSGRTLIEVEL